MRDRQYLFSDTDWFSVKEHQLKQLREEISAVNGDRLLNASVDDIARYFEETFKVTVPTLNREDIVVDQREAKIDVSHDPMRWIEDRSRPFYVSGTEVEFEVPFSGDAQVFRVQPTTYTLSPPRAEVRGNLLRIRISGTSLKAEEVQKAIDRTLSEVESYLKALRSNAAELNQQLFAQAKAAIEARRQKLLSDRNLVGALGFKMKQREGMQRTYAAPDVNLKLTPVMPTASSAPYKPEPVLQQDDYEHILGVLNSMAHVMERSPSAFHGMGEEALRSHFLFMKVILKPPARKAHSAKPSSPSLLCVAGFGAFPVPEEHSSRVWRFNARSAVPHSQSPPKAPCLPSETLDPVATSVHTSAEVMSWPNEQGCSRVEGAKRFGSRGSTVSRGRKRS